MYPIVVRLKCPIENGQEQISELRFRRGKLGDMRALLGDKAEEELPAVAAKLCGQPPSVLEALDPDDFSEVFAAVGKCLAPSQKTGAKQ